MRFTIPLLAFALGVTALPTADGPPNVPSKVQTPYEQAEKRSVAVEAVTNTLAKRATLRVEVYADEARNGRHESLVTNTLTCYNLYNGWNDAISSLEVPRGFVCDFYVDVDCRNGYFHVGGGEYYYKLDSSFNDKFSSYRCYA